MADEDNQVEEEVAVDSAEESAVEQDWQESEQRTAAEPANLEELRDGAAV